jgi:hypothetical protein
VSGTVKDKHVTIDVTGDYVTSFRGEGSDCQGGGGGGSSDFTAAFSLPVPLDATLDKNGHWESDDTLDISGVQAQVHSEIDFVPDEGAPVGSAGPGA